MHHSPLQFVDILNLPVGQKHAVLPVVLLADVEQFLTSVETFLHRVGLSASWAECPYLLLAIAICVDKLAGDIVVESQFPGDIFGLGFGELLPLHPLLWGLGSRRNSHSQTN